MVKISECSLQKRFIVFLYNRNVLSCVKDNQDHPDFDDRWADTQQIAIHADSASDALQIAQDRYPRDDGFVVTRIAEMM